MKSNSNQSKVYSQKPIDCLHRSSVCGLQSPVSTRRRQSAFTLLELLIVIALIMVLMGLLIPAFYKVQNKAKEKKAASERSVIGSAITAYKLQEKKFPAPVADLGGGEDVTYGQGGQDNSDVMVLLKEATPPVLDANKLRWDGDNAIDPWGEQYKITLDLDYNGQVAGGYADYKVE